jgi:hypothetical protein
MTGTPIGWCACAGVQRPICIPPDVRGEHVHLIGRPATGKSTVMESMILHDVGQGHGVAVLDPHGGLVQRIAGLLSGERAKRVIYIDPGDPDWVPWWNPIDCRSGLEIGRVTDGLVRAFWSFSTGWSDRTEHLLRHAIFAALRLPRGSLLDVWDILHPRSNKGRRLRAQAIKVADNRAAKLFWRHDFDRYTSADLAPAQHKLSKLLTSGTVSLMLSQDDSAFDLRSIMDSGGVLLMDLSTLGPEAREMLGCFTLSLLHLAALGRGSASTGAHRPFHIYCDDAHRFTTDAIEDLIAETRRFSVSLTLAHQYLSQFTTRHTDVLSSVGSTIIFNVDAKDAQQLTASLRGMVDLDDLISLETGCAIARIGTQVVRLETRTPLNVPRGNCRDLIMARSRAKYCRPTAHVKKAIAARDQQLKTLRSGKSPEGGGHAGRQV